MKKANFYKHILEFKRPGGTSRGILKTKDTYILEITEDHRKGTGECALFHGLSYDGTPDYETKLEWLCQNINENKTVLKKELLHYPSIWFGFEQALLNLKYGKDTYFSNEFTKGKDAIKINGLIWMGDSSFMKEQIDEKLKQKFDCIKLKIGVNWKEEKKIIQILRNQYPIDQLEIRVDANGGFNFEEAKIVLKELSELEIHSIEQPIKAGQPDLLSELCKSTPTPIALDEELIGVIETEHKIKLLEIIQPQYIILKPSLVGGYDGTDEWIAVAEKLGIGWWITSALESNIGLNAIAQYTYSKNPKIPQGLGTGGLFTNNFESKLILKGDQLYHL